MAIRAIVAIISNALVKVSFSLRKIVRSMKQISNVPHCLAALVSPSTRNSPSPTATSTQNPVRVSTSALSSYISFVSAFLSLNTISSTPANEIVSLASLKQETQQSSLMRSPFMTSSSTVSYISTQHGLSETLDVVSTRGLTSHLNQTNSILLVSPSYGLENTSPLMTSSHQGKSDTPALTVTFKEMDSLKAANSNIKVASSKTVRALATQSKNTSKHETEDLINKLLRGQ